MTHRFSHVVLLRPEKRDDYVTLHSPVWPEIAALISKANITNYTIFLVDDLLVSYYEYVGTDFEADMAALDENPTMKQWLALTDPCQAPWGNRDSGWASAEEIWHLR